jgi:carbon-monoxide dehydrogenase medium subunit
MYPASFEYHRPSSVQAAVGLLEQHGDEAKLLAGGHSLIPIMKLRLAQPAHLIDISGIAELAGVRESGSTVTIGAMTRYADVAASAAVMSKFPALAEAAGHIGDVQVRNVGTIGGSLSHADPSADLPAVVLALGATIVASGTTGQRAIAADEFFVSPLTTALAATEVITEVRLPVPADGSGSAYEKLRDPASGYAVVGVAAQVTVSKGAISAVRVGMTGLASQAVRLPSVESALVGQAANPATIARAAAKAADGLGVVDDWRGSAAYKENLARVYTRRALTQAVARATGD